jgi:hypothetical protein
MAQQPKPVQAKPLEPSRPLEPTDAPRTLRDAVFLAAITGLTGNHAHNHMTPEKLVQRARDVADAAAKGA